MKAEFNLSWHYKIHILILYLSLITARLKNFFINYYYFYILNMRKVLYFLSFLSFQF